PSVAVQVRLGQLVAGPVRVEADVRHANVAAGRAMKDTTGNDRLHGGGLRSRVEIEVERLLPHRHEEDEMTRLPEVLLCHLQLDRDVGVLERAEQRRDRLADLEIDRSMLYLDDDVLVERAVERLEVVVGRPGTIVLRV